jgi:4,5-dihydroxyphthalate decarboxylase
VSSGTPPVTLMVGRHRHLDPLRADPTWPARLGIELRAPSGPASGEFPGMVARRTYDFCELAAATFLQARAHGYPLVLVPVTVVARPQHDALVFGPGVAGGLTGARIAIRSYAQTTGVWVRGMLREHSGVTDVTWVTTSPDHVPDVAYPPNVTRAAGGGRVVELLRAGAARAAVIGPEDMADDLRCVFGDPVAAEREWVARHGVVPVNHVLVARDDPRVVARIPAVVELFGSLTAAAEPTERDRWLREHGVDPLPVGMAAITPSLEVLTGYCAEQGVVPAGTRFADLIGEQGR